MDSTENSLLAPVSTFSHPPIQEVVSVPIPFRRLPPAKPTEVKEIVEPVFHRPPDEWLRRISLAVLEVLHGRRQPAQLRGIVSQRVLDQLTLRRSVTRTGGAPQVLTVRISPVTTNKVEVSATFSSGNRVFPLALRAEFAEQKWLITACEIGPH